MSNTTDKNKMVTTAPRLVGLIVATITLFTGMTVQAGMIVSDPKSYSYYVKQLKEAANQLKTAEKNLGVATESKNTLFQMADDLKGTYNRAAGVVKDMQKIKGAIEQTKSAFSDSSKIFDHINSGNPEKAFKEVDINLDKIFVDISRKDVNPWMVQKKRQFEVQKIFKDTLKKSEVEMALMPERLEAIENLAKQIDKTENIKDSQDLTNRLIIEMLIGQERMIFILNQLAQAEVAAQYTGYDEEIAAQFKDRSIAKQPRKKTALEKAAESKGWRKASQRPASELFGL